MTIASMPQPTLPAQPEEPLLEDVILGVDTHKDVHVAAVITVLKASFLAHQEFPPGHRCWMPSTPVLGTLFRRPASSWCGMRRILRSGPRTRS
ncbi:hypothetical protein GCM10010424_74010 [Streptomyces lienomycini]